MLRRTLIVTLLVAAPAFAQPVPVSDCTIDGTLLEKAGEKDGLQLEIVERCRAAQTITFAPADERAARHVHDLKVEQAKGLAEARYRFDLTGYARAANSTSVAVQRGAGVLSLLQGFLLEPRGYEAAPTLDIRMTVPPGLVFATGLPKVGDAWRLGGTTLRFAGFAVLGRLTYRELAVPAPASLRAGQPRSAGVMRVAILDGVSDVARAGLLDWVERTAEAQANWWQGFTAKQMLLALVPVAHRGGVGYGRAVSGGGVTVMVEIGVDVDQRRLFNDWVLTHELIHTGMPFLRGRATWFMEGAATYVEPIIRARAGWKTQEEVWREWVEHMPLGHGAFATGLATASGRQNYWGGATFMLMADLAMRRSTEGASGLEDCFRGALWSGFDGAQRANLDEYVAACDRATGSNVMKALVDRHLAGGQPVDLANLWRELGVSLTGDRIVLDDDAPLARWRRMIVPGPPGVRSKRVRLPWES
jgi:hypothetical protein